MKQTVTIKVGGPQENNVFYEVTARFKALSLEKQALANAEAKAETQREQLKEEP